MKLYYCESLDIMCIVENDEIYKYIGDLCSSETIKLANDMNVWYKANIHPGLWQDKLCGFVLIGEL